MSKEEEETLLKFRIDLLTRSRQKKRSRSATERPMGMNLSSHAMMEHRDLRSNKGRCHFKVNTITSEKHFEKSFKHFKSNNYGLIKVSSSACAESL